MRGTSLKSRSSAVTRTSFKTPNDVLPRTLRSHRKVAVFLGGRDLRALKRQSGNGRSGAPCAPAMAGVWATFISHETIPT